MAHISDIKLIGTDTTLDLSQKAEKGMPSPFHSTSFYAQRSFASLIIFPMWDCLQLLYEKITAIKPCLSSENKQLMFVSKTVFSLYHCSFHVRRFRHRIQLPETQNKKLGFEDFQILQCLSEQRLQEARYLLEKMPERGYSHRIVTWTSLLSKFSKNGFVEEAKTLFDIMPERNIVTYNAMLSGYVQSGRLGEARRIFDEMPERNVVSWTSMLCGLADAGKIDEARKLFDVMPERNVVSWNSMVVGLLKNGDLDEARQVFDTMPDKNQVSQNVMIAGYAENGRMEEARVLFDEGMRERNVVTWTSLIAGYCRIGNVEEGYCLFQRMPERNVVSWTAMIGGLTWNGFYKEALLLFLDMRGSHDIKPNEETLISLAYACAGVGFPRLGKQLHAHLIVNSWHYHDYDGRLPKSLIHMYSMFGVMDFAHCIFSQNLSSDNVQSCNSMINGYIRIGQLEKAEILFDAVPFRDKISWTSMIIGYYNFGEVSKACHLFNNMPDRDAIAWTAMISGHVQNELFAEATYLFSKMLAHGFYPLNSTYSVLLGAAGAMAHIDQGKQFHCMVMKTQPEIDLILDNSLISMYAKCGEIEDAYRIFSDMISMDLISWNSMIVGFSHHGLAKEAMKIFKSMLESGFRPNSVTFLGILSACNHAGLVNQGWELFRAMIDVYAVQPGLEHYICMINLLGRAGKVKEAEELVLRMTFKPDHALCIWGTLLGVCGLRGVRNAGLVARRAARKILELDPLNAAAHVVLCNVYAATGLHAEEGILRKEMGVKGVKKVPGCSWILLKGRVHVFMSGDNSYPQAVEILAFLHETNRKRTMN